MNRFILCLATTILTIFVVWMVRDNDLLATLATIPGAWFIGTVIGTGLFNLVNHLVATFKSIRLRYGKVSLETINKHLSGISPYTSAAPTERARIAVERIYPDGKTLNDDGLQVVFGTGTPAAVRASLGYEDGKAWFENAPIGLLIAELHAHSLDMHVQQHDDKEQENFLQLKQLLRSRKLEMLIKDYEVFAVTFARPDLLSATMLMKAGHEDLWSKVIDVTMVHRVLPAALLEAVLQVVPADILNDLMTLEGGYCKPWMVLFERLETKPKDYRTVLGKFAEAGVDNIESLHRKQPQLPAIHRLRKIEEAISAQQSTLQAARKKRDLLAKANGFTRQEEEARLLRWIHGMSAVGTAPARR